MPRRIIGAAFVSLDGVMQAPGGPTEDPSGGFAHGGWLTAVMDEELGENIDRVLAEPFALLLGRRTYDIFAAYWPLVPDDNPIAATFRRIGKYVLTGSDQPLAWEGSHRLADIDALAALKETDGPDLVIQGSSTLYPQLLARGLIDRLELMIAPILLGGGKRLFGTGTPAGLYRLVAHKITRNGIVLATYEPDGPLVTGSFADIEPGELELARRKAIAEGTW